MVFGVAGFSLIVQGLTMDRLLTRLGIVQRSEAEELYEQLLGRIQMVDSALEATTELYENNRLPKEVYDDFRAEYNRERDDLKGAISTLLSEYPEIQREELLIGERQVLKYEKNALMESIRTGIVGNDAGEPLLEEINLKLSRVDNGESTVKDESPEGYEEFWRDRAHEFGILPADRLDGKEPDDEPADDRG